jgi:hypothetical protein
MSAPAVAVLANGKDSVKMFAAWKDQRTGDANVYWTSSESQNFTDDAPVHDKSDGEQNHPSLAVDSSGNVWVAWEDARSRRQQIRVRSSATNGDRVASADEDSNAGFPSLAANGGVVAVAYETKRERTDAVVFRLLQAR